MINSLIDLINSYIETYIDNYCEKLTAEHCGLDPRAGRELYVSDNYIIVTTDNARKLDYYGVFEYVDSDYKHIFPGWAIYERWDLSVGLAIDRGMEHVYNKESTGETV